ncbi:MAG: glutamine-hydrolyzing GMP synthase [Desulfobacterota bacterium]|nr:glutamine-hydrolyzing GMP synthase [Thermodesulfobacteriota bacterium]MDW8002086.1 glutamine-hydrolyzing GMP synthase [Deltaproteobacteria bacterium]
MDYHRELILILDFGSQYTQLIARRIRELGVYSEIHPYNMSLSEIVSKKPIGIVLSGGPKSVRDENAPFCDRRIFDLKIPILGICYGLQLITYFFGGDVERAKKAEYGKSILKIGRSDPFFEGLGSELVVWMSHKDQVVKLPDGFSSLASTENSPYAVVRSDTSPIYGVQFHPEVHHTERGKDILKNFLFKICGARGLYSPASFIEESIKKIRQEVGNENVICALSGGVDSSCVAALMHRAIGDRLHCVFVNNGLLRKNEVHEVLSAFEETLKIRVHYVDKEAEFLRRLKGVKDPEKKRKIIGRLFIRTFEEEAKKIGNISYLAQGTLYPDLIESRSHKGPSATIKTHHNVGGLPKRMKFKLIEPLKELFKDEVRIVGRLLGLPDYLVERQPFPGPGLAVRIIGEVTHWRLKILREADAIIREEIENKPDFKDLWQSFAVLIPVKTVGVMGDERTYAYVIAIRAVHSVDGMTADWARLPYETLDHIARRIINEVEGVNRVVYDITSKPPGTIEWE